MAGKSKAPWAVFVGGPLDGQRELLQPNDQTKTTIIRNGAEYQVTSQYKKVQVEVWKVQCRVLKFIAK